MFLFREVGDFDSAIDYYNKASILKSADASILQKKAYLLYEYGKTAEALTGFRVIIFRKLRVDQPVAAVVEDIAIESGI